MAPKKGSAKNQTPTVPDGDHIVFGDDKRKKRSKEPAITQGSSSDPPKPTARQVIGGASWTGKLPVNLLSEHCQRQKWNKPDYSMRQMPGKDGEEKMYRSDVILSKTDSKTGEMTRLPPIRLPPSDAQLADQSSALEARHFAATYTLFRIQSMKNIHMTLPPKYRDLWKGDFARLKKQDIDDGHAWRYDEDPFAAEAKRQEIFKSMEKRKEEQKKRQEIEAAHQTDGEGRGFTVTVPVSDRFDTKAWEQAPYAAMGQQIRIDVEEIIRKRAIWNQYGLTLSLQEKAQIIENVTQLGFRQSHIEEALESCKDQQEVLEWLLVHIPEDDLPKWTFPANYNVGVTLASGDLEKEGKLRRLATAGYPHHLCASALRSSSGDERVAAFRLQHLLAPEQDFSDDKHLDDNVSWEEEMHTLEAIFGENITISGKFQCSILMSTSTGQALTLHVMCPASGYPHQTIPAVAVDIAIVPAYIRLAAAKKVVQYAQTNLLGEVMVYNICQWLETELPTIIENPGRLSAFRFDSSFTDGVNHERYDEKDRNVTKSDQKLTVRRSRKVDQRSGDLVLELWKSRQATSEQSKMNQVRQRLPAWARQKEITQTIDNRQITIISGETGSGKSTQVVQFVLDNEIQRKKGSNVNILCTQPRRVATLSLADRVSNERCSQVGDEIGYIIRGESRVSEKTKITFMTTGVLLKRLQSHTTIEEALTDVTHIFVDEVHERSLDTDFLLALLKGGVVSRPQIKVILMSATLDADAFSNYFGGSDNVALVNIEGRTFPVQDLYLEDIVSLVSPEPDNLNIGKAIQSLGFGTNYNLVRDLVVYIDQKLGSQSGSILIFLPGTMEIERCLRAISNHSGFLVLPLHASLSPTEQRKVFPPAPPGRRKVVAATNVAETSITIEDVVAVIDTGKVKETSYDADNAILRLEERWASLAACKQRRGRAGRVREGTCYKLFTRNTESKMSAKNVPEIQRVPLEQLCLAVKATGADRDIAHFLSQTLTPPDSSAVFNAIKTLHAMNALEDNRLTALGSYLSMIPADLRCAKLIVYGALFDCLEPCLTIAAILNVKSPFTSPRDKREEANDARMKFSSADGDLLLDMKAYDEWSELNEKLPHRQLVDWCSSHYISNQVMRDISSTRQQLLDSVKDAGIVPLNYRSSAGLGAVVSGPDTAVMLTALIAAALQPQLALISFPSKKYVASMSGAKELDPEARSIRFFIPDEKTRPVSKSVTPTTSRSGTPKPEDSAVSSNPVQIVSSEIPLFSRIFVHPASCLFSAQTFPRHSTHLSYFTKMTTTKPFIRDLTPLNIYSLLLFGGKLVLDTSGRGLVVGGTWRVRGWARVGVLISRLRALLEKDLSASIDSGSVLLGGTSGSEVVQLVKRLLLLNGQDQ